MTDDARQRILAACFKFMRPIARMLLANGVGYREFEEVCRRAFVRTASDEFGVRGRETNSSRISAMTGIPRKEIQRLKRNAFAESDVATNLLSPLADLLQIWATASDYVDDAGYPRTLGLGGTDKCSFEKLVKLCMGDIPPGAVKAELIRLGVVEYSPENRLVLKRRTLIPSEVDVRLESAILYSLHGLAKTVAYNTNPIGEDRDRRFERFVESCPLTEDEILELREVLSTRLTSISEELDAILSAERSSTGETETRRIGVGIYYTE